MKSLLSIFSLMALATGSLVAADTPAATPPPKPKAKIIPGQVIVPTGSGEMRRIWGELVSLDLKTRTGKFRKEDTNEIMSFTVMPYAELLHHAANGDLQDFRVGERAIFRLHENEKGEWVWLTYIQDQMNMMNGHKEYFHVDSIDAAKGQLVVTQASADKSYVREQGIKIDTDKDTRYWKEGQTAKFADIKIGDKIRTKTHGVGEGKVQMCWEVFLDDASLLKFQNEQKAVHLERLEKQGSPAYVDDAGERVVKLSLFREAQEVWAKLKVGQRVSIAPAGVDRAPSGARLSGSITEATLNKVPGKVTVTLDGPAQGFNAAGLARLWSAK